MKCELAWYDVRLKEMSVAEVGKDAKTQLQELLQSRRKPLLKYEVVEVEGEAHVQTFTVECRVSVLQKPTRATANSRRSAEKQAAAAALELISL